MYLNYSGLPAIAILPLRNWTRIEACSSVRSGVGIVAIVCNSGYVYAAEVVTGSCLVGGKKAEIAVGVVPGDCHWAGGGRGDPFQGWLAWQDELAGSSPRARLSGLFGLRHQASVR